MGERCLGAEPAHGKPAVPRLTAFERASRIPRMRKLLSLMLPLTLVFAVACGDDDVADDDDDTDEHTSEYPACAAIIEACHPVDTGDGDIAECHSTAHGASSNAVCEPEQERCVALCEAAAGDDDDDATEEDAGADAAN